MPKLLERAVLDRDLAGRGIDFDHLAVGHGRLRDNGRRVHQ
jgi:hypothetical protein